MSKFIYSFPITLSPNDQTFVLPRGTEIMSVVNHGEVPMVTIKYNLEEKEKQKFTFKACVGGQPDLSEEGYTFLGTTSFYMSTGQLFHWYFKCDL